MTFIAGKMCEAYSKGISLLDVHRVSLFITSHLLIDVLPNSNWLMHAHTMDS